MAHTDHDHTFTSGSLTLRGTLTLPVGAGPFPAALLVVGSGEVDRNSDHRKLPLGVTRQLAASLADGGIASLRFDKRGVGASDGAFLSAGMSDNLADARAAMASLRAHPRVDADRVVVLGHSEGALVAAALGAEGPVAGVGLLAGPARDGEATLRWQGAAIFPTLPRPVRAILRTFRIDLEAKQAKTIERLRASTTDVVRLGGRRHNARWFREFLDFDPRPLLQRIHAPVLALTGAKDLQSPPEDVQAVGRVVAGPFEGHVLDDLNHILRHEPGPANLRRYRRLAAEPLDPRVVEIVTAWCRATTGEPQRTT